jgi:ankyrin repeat protein
MKYIKTYERLNDSGRFLRAAEKGNLDEVKKLLNQGIDVNIKDNEGNTALILASLYGHLEIVKEF